MPSSSSASNLVPRLALGLSAVVAIWLSLPVQTHAQSNDWSSSLRDSPSTANDPWQSFNRSMYAFNRQLDAGIFAPITHAYMSIAPLPLRRALGAAVDNLREPRTVINDLLQARPSLAGQAARRFIINSTVGGLGLYDAASASGLPAHRSDFGQTLGRYGLNPGRYVFVPVIGPLDLRDGVGRVVDVVTDPISLAVGGLTTPFGASRLAASAIDFRSGADAQIQAVNDDATDPYATVRSAYVQRRAYLVDQAQGVESDLPAFDLPAAAP